MKAKTKRQKRCNVFLWREKSIMGILKRKLGKLWFSTHSFLLGAKIKFRKSKLFRNIKSIHANVLCMCLISKPKNKWDLELALNFHDFPFFLLWEKYFDCKYKITVFLWKLKYIWKILYLYKLENWQSICSKWKLIYFFLMNLKLILNY